MKSSLRESIENQVAKVCIEVVRNYIQKNVYDAYIPDSSNPYSYDRTMDLLNAVSVGEIKVGIKFVTFEVYMNPEMIQANITGDNEWNQHASVEGIDVSEYIPLWIEEGTSGSLWDREGAHFMSDAHFELSGGSLAQELANALRKQGWNITMVY